MIDEVVTIRAGITIQSKGFGDTDFIVTEFPSGKQTKLPEKEAWEMYTMINKRRTK